MWPTASRSLTIRAAVSKARTATMTRMITIAAKTAMIRRWLDNRNARSIGSQPLELRPDASPVRLTCIEARRGRPIPRLLAR